MSEIHAILGTDEGRVSEEALKRFTTLKSDDSGEFGNDIIEGSADNTDHAAEILSQTMEAVQTLPFFGMKVVWLKDANFLGDDRTGGAERTKEGVEKLLSVLQAGLALNISFLLSASVIDKRRAFYKFLKKSAKLEICDKVDVTKNGWEDQVAALVRKESEPLGLSFTHEAMELFIQQAGEDTRLIKNELEKLSLFLSPETEVGIDTVRRLIPLNRKGVIWEISRCIETGDGERAIQLVNAQLEKGENAVGILRAAMIPTMRNAFYAKLAMDEAGVSRADGRSFSGLIKRLSPAAVNALPKKVDGNVNTWGLGMAAVSVSRGKRSLQKYRDNLDACLKADRALVTSGSDHHMILHRLIIELTT